MQSARVQLSFVTGVAEPGIANASLQIMFGKCRDFLRIRGVEVSTPMFYRDAIERAVGYLGVFVIPLPQANEPALETIVTAWFEGPVGRTVKLRMGEAEVVARSAGEAALFLRHLQQLSEKSWLSTTNALRVRTVRKHRKNALRVAPILERSDCSHVRNTHQIDEEPVNASTLSESFLPLSPLVVFPARPPRIVPMGDNRLVGQWRALGSRAIGVLRARNKPEFGVRDPKHPVLLDAVIWTLYESEPRRGLQPQMGSTSIDIDCERMLAARRRDGRSVRPLNGLPSIPKITFRAELPARAAGVFGTPPRPAHRARPVGIWEAPEQGRFGQGRGSNDLMKACGFEVRPSVENLLRVLAGVGALRLSQ